MTPRKVRIKRNERIQELHDAGLSYTDIIFILVEEGLGRITTARVGQILTEIKE